MSQKAKTILLVLAIILVPVAVGTGYWLYRRRMSQNDPLAPSDTTPFPATPTDAVIPNATVTPVEATANILNNNWPLIYAPSVNSSLVKQCQQALNDQLGDMQIPMMPTYNGKYITKLDEDGYYGPHTAAVVKYITPGSDGKTITRAMYDGWTGTRPSGTYLLF